MKGIEQIEVIEPLEPVYDILEILISRYGALGIGAAMFAESAGLPFASAIVYLTAGTMILRGTVSFWSIFWYSTVGITLGSIVSYIIGLLGSIAGRAVKNSLFHVKHNPDLIKTSSNKSRMATLWDKYGNFSIFMAQLWGVTRTFGSFPAGAMHVNFLLFILYTFLGGAIFSLMSIAISLALTGTMGLAIRLLRALADLSPWLLLIPAAIIISVIYFFYRKPVNLLLERIRMKYRNIINNLK